MCQLYHSYPGKVLIPEEIWGVVVHWNELGHLWFELHATKCMMEFCIKTVHCGGTEELEHSSSSYAASIKSSPCCLVDTEPARLLVSTYTLSSTVPYVPDKGLKWSCPCLCLSLAVFQQQAVHSPLEQQKQKQGGGGGPIPCQNCGKPCKGEALRVQNKHFHIKCFVCKGM